MAQRNVQGVPENARENVTAGMATRFTCMYGVLPIRTFKGIEILVLKGKMIYSPTKKKGEGLFLDNYEIIV